MSINLKTKNTLFNKIITDMNNNLNNTIITNCTYKYSVHNDKTKQNTQEYCKIYNINEYYINTNIRFDW